MLWVSLQNILLANAAALLAVALLLCSTQPLLILLAAPLFALYRYGQCYEPAAVMKSKGHRLRAFTLTACRQHAVFVKTCKCRQL